MEDRPPRLSSTILLARILSIAGHPFVLVPLMLAAATRNWVWTAAVSAGMILPLLVITLRNVRRGTWSDPDVSRQDQRSGLYRAGIPLLAATAVLLYFLDAGPEMMRGIAAAVAMLLLGVLGNRFLKISLHLMIAAYCAVLIGDLYPQTIPWLLIALAAIAWSRRKLERHTRMEVAVGTVIGAAAAWFAIG
jgi:membrane-associated phospholipid phosphatase